MERSPKYSIDGGMLQIQIDDRGSDFYRISLVITENATAGQIFLKWKWKIIYPKITIPGNRMVKQNILENEKKINHHYKLIRKKGKCQLKKNRKNENRNRRKMKIEKKVQKMKIEKRENWKWKKWKRGIPRVMKNNTWKNEKGKMKIEKGKCKLKREKK